MIQPIPAGTSVVVTAPVGVSGETLLTVNSGQGLTLAGGLTTGTTIDVFKGAAIIGTTPLATDNIFVARAYNLSAGGHWDGTDSITSTAAEFDTTRLTAVGVIGNNQSGSPLYSATRPFHGVTPTQPSTYTSQQQLKNNSAAPFFNSLITPCNANAADVSYAADYTNSGTGVHPSEPNYIWSEAGTNYNPATGTTVLGDNDPSAGSENIFTAPHLTGLMNAAGVSWKTYQEDFQIPGQGPTVSASGTLPGRLSVHRR